MYRRRRIAPLHSWAIETWRIKAYHIAHEERTLRDDVLAAAFNLVKVAATACPQPHHEVGFVGIHEGECGTFIFFCWWSDQKELRHRSWYGAPNELQPCEPADAIGCVWDLALIGFEADAWRRHMLIANGNVTAYLDDTFDGTF